MSRTSQQLAMYLRMLRRAAILRKGQAVAALGAIIVAVAAGTAMLNLYVDAQSKLRKEFRNFGANIVVQAKSAEAPSSGSSSASLLSPGSEGEMDTTTAISVQAFSGDELNKISAIVGDRGLAVPFGYAVVRTEADQPIVVAGTDFSKVRQLNPWWSVSAWPDNDGEVLVGIRASKTLKGGVFTLKYGGRPLQLKQAGTVETGAGEDSRIYIPLTVFAQWTGLQPSAVEIAAFGPPSQVSAIVEELRQALPQADINPVRQITEGEANILAKTRSTMLWCSACIIIIAALCVLATLMGWVFDRRRDFAIMKALGASDGLIASFVAGESAILGVAGAIVGFGLGVGIAAAIGRLNFHTPISPRIAIFPVVAFGALCVTLLSTLLPLRLLREIQPAIILRGE